MKKTWLLLCTLVLCLALPLSALAAYDPAKPPCQTEGHEKNDGVDHNRPEPCWITGHFNCDGLNHDYAPCGYRHHYNCDGLDHGPAVCGAQGHTSCKGRHAAAACGVAGHCAYDGQKHEAARCGIAGHFACDGLTHTAAACGIAGHAVCDGADHSRAACGRKGHSNCDGLEHAAAACGRSGHCVSDGLAHEAAPCGYEGHFLCDGRTHETAACGVEGHYACEVRAHLNKPVSQYCSAVPQHMACQGNPEHYCDPAQGGCGETYRCTNSNAHTACRMCGLLWCDRSLGGHETPCNNPNHRPCVYALQGKTWRASEHPRCDLCGGGKCTGRHGAGVCVPVCDQCGGVLRDGKTHRAPCGEHYICITKGRDHGWCGKCGQLKCRGESKEHVCPEK